MVEREVAQQRSVHRLGVFDLPEGHHPHTVSDPDRGTGDYELVVAVSGELREGDYDSSRLQVSRCWAVTITGRGHGGRPAVLRKSISVSATTRDSPTPAKTSSSISPSATASTTGPASSCGTHAAPVQAGERLHREERDPLVAVQERVMATGGAQHRAFLPPL